MSSNITLKAYGLNTQPNQLEVEEGSLSVAKNVVIRRNDVLESRRGFKVYGTSFGSSSDRAKQLLNYKEKILFHYNNTILFDSDDNGTFIPFDGSYTETEAGLRIKSLEANGNLYFTSSNGIMKISAKTEADFTNAPGFITKAGGVKAIDLTGKVIYTYGDQTSFFTQDGAVAYRILWATKDNNTNLILGSPSQRIEIFNSLLTLLLQDYMHLLGALDSINQGASLIDDGDYVNSLKLGINASASELRSNLISLTTKIDTDILYANTTGTGAPLVISTAVIATGVCTITFSSGDPTLYLVSGSNIFLSGFTAPTGILNGAQVVSTVNSTQITFNTTASGVVTIDPAAIIDSYEYRILAQPSAPSTPATDQQLVDIQNYMLDIINRLILEPDGIIPTALSNTYIQTLDVTKAVTTQLNITIPKDITSNYFFQVYRSDVALATGGVVLSTDVTPSDELQQVYEAYPTAAELAQGYITVNDVVPDAFRGANLYTNAATGEGILQANDIPPFAKDIKLFKNSVFYANTKTRQQFSTALLGVQNMIDDFNGGNTPELTIASSNGIFNTYSFITGLSEETDITCNDGSTLVASAAPSSYFLINSANNATQYYVWYQVGSSTDPAISGKTGIEVLALAGDTDVQIAEKTRDALNIQNSDFSAVTTSNVVTVLNNDTGYTDDIDAGTSGFSILVTTQGRGEQVSKEKSIFTCVADVAGSLAGTYFTVNTAFNQQQYYIWFKVNGSGADPTIANKTGILVDLALNDSAPTVAATIASILNTNYSTQLTASLNSADLTIENVNFGPAIDATVGTSGFTLSILVQGLLQVELSTAISPAQAVDLTSNSLIRVINRNTNELIYGYYTSGAQDIPGLLLFEAKDLSTPNFYITTNNINTGASFNPTFEPDIQISSISTGSPSTMLITTATTHGLVNLDTIVISGSDCTPSIDGYHQITLVSPTTFRINETVTNSGTKGGIISTSAAIVSTNQEAKNRIYYSKFQQPEAVPILNYFDVGANDKAILRIYPLRDSLFVFKEDALYRISGEAIPFNLALFDGSCNIVAADSVSPVNNVLYLWTRQGIQSVTESGVKNISRPIDITILPLSSSNYANFKTATWAIGYESDNSYTVYTVSNPNDTVATVGYRYSTLTNTFTTIDRSYTCGIINFIDDKMYMGAGDLNNIEQERKTFSRYDFSDREYGFNIDVGKYLNKVITLDSIANIDLTDVFVQTQKLTIYEFNSLLKKLDIDPGINDSNYYSLLKISPGASLRSSLISLAQKLDADSGTADNTYESTIESKTGNITAISAGTNNINITSVAHGLISGRQVLLAATNSDPNINGQFTVTVVDADNFTIETGTITPGTSGTFSTVDNDFEDIKVCYNETITKLNADGGVSFSNYQLNDHDTIQEILITDVNRVAKRITVAEELDYVVGPFTIFKSIDCEAIYTPNTFSGDPLTLKHVREATLMFDTLAFTEATISFATDLLPKFEEVPVNGDTNGRFGYVPFGDGFFGGASHSAPIRTYIPRNCQRCRYIVVKFNHRIAREKWSLYGITLTGETQLSTRAYK